MTLSSSKIYFSHFIDSHGEEIREAFLDGTQLVGNLFDGITLHIQIQPDGTLRLSDWGRDGDINQYIEANHLVESFQTSYRHLKFKADPAEAKSHWTLVIREEPRIISEQNLSRINNLLADL